MNYKEAESLIIDAYFKDEINPYKGEFCFCGTLNHNNVNWRSFGNKFYSSSEFVRMEYALLNTIDKLTFNNGDYLFGGNQWSDNSPFFTNRAVVMRHPNYENALFEGMVAALNVLRDIHKSKGENVDEEVVFKKRVLVKYK